jgi:hypothetical protein
MSINIIEFKANRERLILIKKLKNISKTKWSTLLSKKSKQTWVRLSNRISKRKKKMHL